MYTLFIVLVVCTLLGYRVISAASVAAYPSYVWYECIIGHNCLGFLPYMLLPLQELIKYLQLWH